MRTSAPDLPVAPAARNRRAHSTMRPARRCARWNATLVPTTPPPTTTTSTFDGIVERGSAGRGRLLQRTTPAKVAARPRQNPLGSTVLLARMIPGGDGQ